MRMPNVALLDTNVLLLWLVGLTDPSLFITFKRVDVFSPDDFKLLAQLLKRFQKLISTPHVLAEVSNFVDQAPQHRRRELVASLRTFAQQNKEHYEAAITLTRRDEFAALGLTDTGLAALSAEAVVITTDFHLSARIVTLGGHVLNFNHHRSTYLVSR